MKDSKKYIKDHAVEGKPIYSIFVTKCCDAIINLKIFRARYSKEINTIDPAISDLSNEWRFE
jgi:hypothetical protein